MSPAVTLAAATAAQPTAARPAPAPSGRPRTTLELTRRGRLLLLLAGIAAAAAWTSGEPNARLAAALLLAPLLLDLACKPRHLHRLDAVVRSRRTVAGAAFREELELRGPARRIRELTVCEPRTMAGRGSTALVERLHGSCRVQLQARSGRRSHLLDRVFALRTQHPFGFVAARAVLRSPVELVTEPQRVRLPPSVLLSLEHPARADRERRAYEGTEYHSLREHRFEEDARGVHALRSASLGVLVRRITQGTLPREVGIVLDLRRPAGQPRPTGQRRFEWSLSACATLLDLLHVSGARVQVLVLGSRTARATLQDAGSHSALLTFLSEADPAPHRPLDDKAFQALTGCDRCFWIAAGGHLDQAELRLLPGGAVLLERERR